MWKEKRQWVVRAHICSINSYWDVFKVYNWMRLFKIHFFMFLIVFCKPYTFLDIETLLWIAQQKLSSIFYNCIFGCSLWDSVCIIHVFCHAALDNREVCLIIEASFDDFFVMRCVRKSCVQIFLRYTNFAGGYKCWINKTLDSANSWRIVIVHK